jgi:isopropylmalate/homocitrate/citramalate synthase
MSREKRKPIYFVDVTQRDGEQMRIDEVEIDERIEAFDALASTGIKTFEIGHLGNDTDQTYAEALVKHINENSDYDDISLQVLFGSQSEILTDGLQWLDGFDKDRVVVHVYDRLDENMLDLASKYYDYHESARRVSAAIDIAYENGFRKFSVSGEGATGSSVGDAILYYGSILEHCKQKPENLAVNVNLPSTNGTSAVGNWRPDELEAFNFVIKNKFPETTTSIHAHNDFGSAVEFSVQLKLPKQKKSLVLQILLVAPPYLNQELCLQKLSQVLATFIQPVRVLLKYTE